MESRCPIPLTPFPKWKGGTEPPLKPLYHPQLLSEWKRGTEPSFSLSIALAPFPENGKGEQNLPPSLSIPLTPFPEWKGGTGLDGSVDENLLREEFAQLGGEFRGLLFGDEMAAIGDRTAAGVNRDAAKGFDYQIAAAARSAAAEA
jgi:hypothetical protein